jgi:hypothetical protein
MVGGERLVKKPLTWSLVDLAAASHKPHLKVVAAPTDATVVLVEVPRHLEGMWGGPKHTDKGKNWLSCLRA